MIATNNEVFKFILLIFLASLFLFINFDRIKKFLILNSSSISLSEAGKALDKALAEIEMTHQFFNLSEKDFYSKNRGAKLLVSKLDCQIWGKCTSTGIYSKIDYEVIIQGELKNDGTTLVSGKDIYTNLSIARSDLSRIIKKYVVSELVISEWEK